jgi:hypothetical protein
MFNNTRITSVDSIAAQVDSARRELGNPMVLIPGDIESYVRKRLIEKRIPFIIPGRQMFLPELLIDLIEFAPIPKEIPELMQPAAQFLLLYHILKQPLVNINLKTIADKLDYNPMTITRAAFFLHNTGLCRLEGTKEKTLNFELNNRDLWEKALPLMTSPVKKSNYYSGYLAADNFRITSINALAHYSDINEEPVQYLAIKTGAKELKEGPDFKKTGKIEANICIEEWKYRPSLLSNNEYVDPLSLYLCLRNNNDERIEMALQQLLKNFKW